LNQELAQNQALARIASALTCGRETATLQNPGLPGKPNLRSHALVTALSCHQKNKDAEKCQSNKDAPHLGPLTAPGGALGRIKANFIHNKSTT
jgi:hypothetical protein